MQILINIDDEDYDDITLTGENTINLGVLLDLREAVRNGTPLPKGHGRLIDADELYDGFIDGTEGYDCQTWNRIEIGDIIEDVPTIIEADKE